MPEYQYSTDYDFSHKSFSSTLMQAATDPYHASDWYAPWFARVKLRIDPAFSTILQQGLIPDGSRLLDLGCGQGLLASCLIAAHTLARRGCWPKDWAPAPQLSSIKGIDSVPLDIQRGQQALGSQAELRVADICTAEFNKSDVIVILDVLHYIDYQAQEDVLRRVKQALSPNGRLILRVGNAAGGLWFKTSYWYDRLVWFVRVHKDNPLFCRSLDNWKATLTSMGFDTHEVRMNRGISLSNTMLVATNTTAS